jgi:hypothetical protein
MEMGKKVLITLALVGAMVALPASAAFAHDCFVVNRSSQGAQGAGNSAEATGFSHGWVSFDMKSMLEQAQVTDADAALADWISQGFKAFYATRIDKAIGEDSSNPNLGNLKGLDHFSESPLFGAFVQTILNWGGDPSLLDE